MFGLLNESESRDSLDPANYAKNRGRFYLIWNASKISGRPMLVALMAGESAHEAEKTDTPTLLGEINARLQKTFAQEVIPEPLEVIVTRWKQDQFTKGTYSYVAPETRPGDYDLMAQPVGNLHFAGEATCGTHPATVHGAFLSGLRVAADVMESMAGPVTLPSPLVGFSTSAKTDTSTRYAMADTPSLPGATNTNMGGTWGSVNYDTAEAAAREDDVPANKEEHDNITLASVPPAAAGMPARKSSGPPKQSVCAEDRSFWVQPAAFDSHDLNYEAALMGHLYSQIGERPTKPSRPGVNPFLLYTKDKWEEVKAFCSAESPVAGRDVIRQTIGKWWKESPDSVKQPYVLQSRAAQEAADALRREHELRAQEWDDKAREIRKEYRTTHLPPVKNASGPSGRGAGEVVGVSKRKTNVSNCVVLDHA